MTSLEEFRATIASVNGRLEELRRSRHREFEVGCEGLIAVAQRRFPTAARLGFECDFEDGAGGTHCKITDISDVGGEILWLYDSMQRSTDDNFTVMLQSYASTLQYGTDLDTCLGWSDRRGPGLIIPTI